MLTSCNVDFDSTYLSIYIYIYVHGVDFFKIMFLFLVAYIQYLKKNLHGMNNV